jgi:hypothetical protein
MSYTTSLADTARKEITIRPSLNAISSHETNTVPSPGGELRWSFAVGIGRGIGGADKPGGVAVGGGVVAGKGNLSARTAALRYLVGQHQLVTPIASSLVVASAGGGLVAAAPG